MQAGKDGWRLIHSDEFSPPQSNCNSLDQAMVGFGCRNTQALGLEVGNTHDVLQVDSLHPPNASITRGTKSIPEEWHRSISISGPLPLLSYL